MTAKLTGTEALQILCIRDGKVVFKENKVRGVVVGEGTPVPVVKRGSYRYYKLFGRFIRPPALIRALIRNDPAELDNEQPIRKPRGLDSRDMEIYEHLNAGKTYVEVGEMYGVKRQRIHQIAVKLENLGYSVSPREIRRAAREMAETVAIQTKFGDARFADAETLKVLKAWLARKRSQAARRGLEFNLTEADLFPIPDTCPALGIPIRFYSVRGVRDDSVSIDRIDNSKGYVKGNVVLVSFKANRIKSDATPDEIEKVAAFYKSLDKQKPLT